MNELIIKMQNKTYKQLANDFTKSLNTFKKSSGMTALTLYLMLNKIDDKQERSEVVKNIMETTGLSKSLISQLNKAGAYIYLNPDCLELGSTACYKLAKEKEIAEAEAEEVEEAEAEEVEEAEVVEAEEEEAEVDLISITFDKLTWHNIFTATAKSKNNDVQELRRFIKNSIE